MNWPPIMIIFQVLASFFVLPVLLGVLVALLRGAYDCYLRLLSKEENTQ
jgi:hypothetical protein